MRSVVLWLSVMIAIGFLSFSTAVAADDSQAFNLDLSSATSGFALHAATVDLQPRLPVAPGTRIPNDPLLSSFRTSVPFLITQNGSNVSSMSGTLRPAVRAVSAIRSYP